MWPATVKRGSLEQQPIISFFNFHKQFPHTTGYVLKVKNEPKSLIMPAQIGPQVRAAILFHLGQGLSVCKLLEQPSDGEINTIRKNLRNHGRQSDPGILTGAAGEV